MPHTSVSRNFRSFVLNKYPALVGNDPFLRFFKYLCFGDFRDKETKQLVVPTRKMAEDFYQQDYTCHFNGQDVLARFRAAVLPGLRWTGHQPTALNSWKGKARQITHLGFDAEMQEALRQECLSPSKEDQVDFITGDPYHRKDRYRQRATETALYEAELAGCKLNPTQTKILDYLRHETSDGHLFIRKLKKNREAIEAAIQQLTPELQVIRSRILSNAYQNPSLYYLPSSKERTCRLSPRGDTLLGLKKEVRRAATKGWVECDLRSSQFAILSAKLQAPISLAFIATGDSLWQEFHRHVSGLDGPPSNAAKAVYKEAIYSLCFGKSDAHLAEFLEQHGVAHLLKHSIMDELLQLRGDWFREIRKAGGAHDVWGQWHAINETIDPETGKGRRWAGAIGATVIQSVEMEIIAPIFDVAKRHGKSDHFSVCLFQHDGATLSFNATDRIERAQRKLRAAVESRAKELGVSTVLEFTQL